jgi:hypothetical protein
MIGVTSMCRFWQGHEAIWLLVPNAPKR